MEYYSFNQQINLGTMGEEEKEFDHDQFDSISSSSSSSSSEVSSVASLDSDLAEEVNSSASSSPLSSSPSGSTSSISGQTGPLHDMSSLLHQLPIKRGLSKHFQGKSQSFTSLSDVTSLEDLAKPENPYNKKLKSCKSYAGGLSETHKSGSNSSRLMSKKMSSRGSCSSLGVKRVPSCLGINKPHNNIPHPYRSGGGGGSTTSFSNQTPLFA